MSKGDLLTSADHNLLTILPSCATAAPHPLHLLIHHLLVVVHSAVIRRSTVVAHTILIQHAVHPGLALL